MEGVNFSLDGEAETFAKGREETEFVFRVAEVAVVEAGGGGNLDVRVEVAAVVVVISADDDDCWLLLSL